MAAVIFVLVFFAAVLSPAAVLVTVDIRRAHRAGQSFWNFDNKGDN